MRKRIWAILSGLSGIGTLATWFLRGTFETWFFDKVIQMAPTPNWAWIVEYGPPAAFAVLTIWLLFLWRAKPDAPSRRSAPPAQPARNVEGGPLKIPEWIDHPNYFVWAVACLWIEKKPIAKIHEHHPAYPTLQMLKGHLEAGTIRSLDGTKISASRVSRDELIKLAKMRDERPRFLFPTVSMPKAKSAKPKPDMRLEEVVKRMTGLPHMPLPINSESMKVLDACGEIREKALLGLITVFGGIDWRTTPPADYDRMVRAEIPKEFWRHRKIDVIGFLHPDDNYRGFTCDMTGRRERDDYYGIWFDRNQVEAQWPV